MAVRLKQHAPVRLWLRLRLRLPIGACVLWEAGLRHWSHRAGQVGPGDALRLRVAALDLIVSIQRLADMTAENEVVLLLRQHRRREQGVRLVASTRLARENDVIHAVLVVICNHQGVAAGCHRCCCVDGVVLALAPFGTVHILEFNLQEAALHHELGLVHRDGAVVRGVLERGELRCHGRGRHGGRLRVVDRRDDCPPKTDGEEEDLEDGQRREQRPGHYVKTPLRNYKFL
mmetsp:Transcript_34469/g.110128  ORF Transcript_34469/g.110128 Transcript_34469/m.110128 type:complete len:231 (-) Transcript_34469:409-1101(-)